MRAKYELVLAGAAGDGAPRRAPPPGESAMSPRHQPRRFRVRLRRRARSVGLRRRPARTSPRRRVQGRGEARDGADRHDVRPPARPLVASAKSSYDEQKSELTQMAAKVVLLDRALAHYGPETRETRELLRAATAHAIDQLWPKGPDRRRRCAGRDRRRALRTDPGALAEERPAALDPGPGHEPRDRARPDALADVRAARQLGLDPLARRRRLLADDHLRRASACSRLPTPPSP